MSSSCGTSPISGKKYVCLVDVFTTAHFPVFWNFKVFPKFYIPAKTSNETSLKALSSSFSSTSMSNSSTILATRYGRILFAFTKIQTVSWTLLFYFTFIRVVLYRLFHFGHFMCNSAPFRSHNFAFIVLIFTIFLKAIFYVRSHRDLWKNTYPAFAIWSWYRLCSFA